MRNKIIIIFLILIAGCSWSKRDVGLFAGYTVLNAVDILQTREVFNNPELDEKINPVLTKENYLPVMIGFNILLYFIMDRLPGKYRTVFISPILGATAACVYHNDNIDIKP